MFEDGSNQTITYWARSDENTTDDYGNPDVSNGVTFRGRWEDTNDQVRKPTGELVTSRAVVFVPIDVVVGGFLKLGDYDGAPLESDAQEIQSLIKIPDFRNLTTERRAYL